MTEQIFLNIFILLVFVARWLAAAPFSIKIWGFHTARVRLAHLKKQSERPSRQVDR